MAQQRIRTEVARGLPRSAFEAWFLDWVDPRRDKDGKTPKPAAQLEEIVRTPEPPLPRGGRRINPETEKVYKFCYEELITKRRKRSRVFADARQRFGTRGPGHETDVRRNARRYAERYGLPLP